MTLAPLGCTSDPSAPNYDECIWSFDRYEPSAWEREWLEGEMSGKRIDRECEVLATPVEVDRSARMLRAIRGAVRDGTTIPPSDVELFSRMVYSKRCGAAMWNNGGTRTQLIEPLVGIVRDPLSICAKPPGVPDDIDGKFGLGENDEQSKRHLLIGPAAPWTDRPNDPGSWRIGGFEPWTKVKGFGQPSRSRQNILVDMGASTYGSWGGRPSAVGALWFVDRFKKHAVDFDWIVSYEYEPTSASKVYAEVPPEILPHYLYYNMGVEKTPEGKWNPWRILRGMGVTRDDYIVVKLDIDTPDIENALVDQVLADPGLSRVIDEFFYEHHVNTRAMWGYWGTSRSMITLKDTYRNFTALRSRGIRMHSWP